MSHVARRAGRAIMSATHESRSVRRVQRARFTRELTHPGADSVTIHEECRKRRYKRRLWLVFGLALACGDDSTTGSTSDDGSCSPGDTLSTLSYTQLSGDCPFERGDDALRLLQADAPECDPRLRCEAGILSGSSACRAGERGTLRWDSGDGTGTYSVQSDACDASYALAREEPL
jgi:hypothetical protein